MQEHVVIFGASSPLAEASSELFLERGYLVSTVGRQEPKEKLRKSQFYSFNLENTELIPDLYQTIVSKSGEISRICFFQRYRSAQNSWEKEFAMSIRSTAKFIEQLGDTVSDMEDRSVVVLGSSTDSEVALEQSISHHITKAGLSQILRCYASKLGKRRIRVNGVKPAMILKERALEFYEKNPALVSLFKRVIPLQRMGKPSEIAKAVLFLSSKEASYITGQMLNVDGGLSTHEAASLARLSASMFNPILEDSRWAQWLE